MAPLSAAVLLLASFAAGEGPAAQRLTGAAALSQAAADSPDATQAKDGAAAAMDGNPTAGDSVADDGTRSIKKGLPLSKSAGLTAAAPTVAPPPPAEEPKGGKLGTELMLGGAALLGGLQGWFGAGVVGAAAGAGLGLAAAWLFHKKDYGGAFGVTAGAIVGTALAGPIGGLVGAVVGGLLGHFLGKLFL
ncbi:MAG: hypothetical protein KGL74_06295 [Elusimicrobia bacterium]|nr:hypothetical protein [Elusimicrobiota bacterium]